MKTTPPWIRKFRLAFLLPALAIPGCADTGQPPDQTQQDRIGLVSVAVGLTAPLVLTSAGDDTGRLFIADQPGMIRLLMPEGGLREAPFLDIRDRLVSLQGRYDERGLLGLAFHPDYRGNGRFFVYYSAPLRSEGPRGWNHTSRLSEFRVSSDDPDKADPTSERVLLEIDQPQANHNGGQIIFGPDGYLYVSLGDGGGANDVGEGHPPGGNGQDITTLLGSILRLDVDAGKPYGVPADNPFVESEGRDEIFAYGFRNPYRMSFDRGGQRDLFVADVGQNLREEIDIATLGGNYGWNIREGLQCFDPQNPNEPPEKCPSTGSRGEPLIDPIIEYGHEMGIATVGGYVYRGTALGGLTGDYLFADWSTGFAAPGGRLYAASPPGDGEGTWAIRELRTASGDRVGRYILSLGQDDKGELYLLTSRNSGPTGSSGEVFRIVPPTQ